MITLAVASILAVFLFAPADGAQEVADLVIVNGRVYTLDEGQPWAEGLAIRGEWILAVGTNAEIEKYKGPDTRAIDAGDAFVSPGFNDSHVHVESTGRLLTGVNLLDVHTADGFKKRIQETASRLPEGSWIARGM